MPVPSATSGGPPQAITRRLIVAWIVITIALVADSTLVISVNQYAPRVRASSSFTWLGGAYYNFSSSLPKCAVIRNDDQLKLVYGDAVDQVPPDELIPSTLPRLLAQERGWWTPFKIRWPHPFEIDVPPDLDESVEMKRVRAEYLTAVQNDPKQVQVIPKQFESWLASGRRSTVIIRWPLFIHDVLFTGALLTWIGVTIAAVCVTRRRATVQVNAGRCPRCNYDLSGTGNRPCPECNWSTRDASAT